VPFIDANGVSLHYALAGQHGPSVVLLHELGGTMNSWNKVAPRLATRYRVLRYDQRGSGLSEKVRQEFSNDVLVEDFEAIAKGLGLAPPYHFVTVAAAATQALRFLEKHPEQVGSLTLCNPAPGVDPSRAAALDERAAFAMREGMRASLTRPNTTPIAAAIWATIRWDLAMASAHWRAPTCCTCCRWSAAPPWWSPAATTPCARTPAAPIWQRRFPARASS
jgi:pimeloyl-ACP methyl ester carboxylesterase